MAIPEGYRLLTTEDLGRVWGEDIESTVYIDTSVTPKYLASKGSGQTIFVEVELNNDYFGGNCCFYSEWGWLDAISCVTDAHTDDWSHMYVKNNTQSNWTSDYTFFSVSWDGCPITMVSNLDWNNWLYVKDKVSEYRITYELTNVSANPENVTKIPANVTPDTSITLEFAADVGYVLPPIGCISVTGATIDEWARDTGNLTIRQITSDMVITMVASEYKMVDATVLDAGLTKVANAIRQKGSTSEALSFPEGMVNAILAIQTGN